MRHLTVEPYYAHKAGRYGRVRSTIFAGRRINSAHNVGLYRRVGRGCINNGLRSEWSTYTVHRELNV